MELVTGHSGSDHVDSTDAGAMHAGIVGTGTYVLGTGGRLVATMQSANVVRIADGDLMMQGRHATIEVGAYDELTIQNGTQAQKRNDLVVAHYERKTSAPYTESLDLRVIKGTPTSGEPTDPEYREGDILAGDAVVEAPLYRIPLDGITAGDPVPLFDVLLPMADLWDSVSQTEADVDALSASMSGKLDASRVHIGSKVVELTMPSGGGWAVKDNFLTQAELRSMLGRTFNGATDCVVVWNGDWDAANVLIHPFARTSSGGGNVGVYVTSPVTWAGSGRKSSARVGYMVVEGS